MYTVSISDTQKQTCNTFKLPKIVIKILRKQLIKNGCSYTTDEDGNYVFTHDTRTIILPKM